MRICAALVVFSMVLLLFGCGGDSLEEQGEPLAADVELTPAGTGDDFVLVGETGVFFNSAPGAIDTPTLLRITRFPTTVGLVAPVPEGFGFVAAAAIEPVTVASETVVAAPVILRIPPSRSLPEGRRLLILIADTGERFPVFRPLLTEVGEPTLATMRDDGLVEFPTKRLGSFLVASDEQ